MPTNESSKKDIILKVLKNFLFITFGAIVAGFALEAFLVPNSVIDGGVIGISMIISHVTKWNLGLLVIVLNLPFIVLAFKKMGKMFVLQTAYANVILALALNFFHSYKVTNDILLSTVFGGIVLGAGVGLILKTKHLLMEQKFFHFWYLKSLGVLSVNLLWA